MIRILVSGIVLSAMVWAWFIPESWKRDCDICGTYQGTCSSFTISKNSNVVEIFRDCGTVRYPSKAIVRMTLTKVDSASFLLALSKEQAFPVEAGKSPALVRLSKDSSTKKDSWMVQGGQGLFELFYEQKSK